MANLQIHFNNIKIELMFRHKMQIKLLLLNFNKLFRRLLNKFKNRPMRFREPLNVQRRSASKQSTG